MLVNLHLLSRSGVAQGGKSGFRILQVEHFQLELGFPGVRTLFTLGVAEPASVQCLGGRH